MNANSTQDSSTNALRYGNAISVGDGTAGFGSTGSAPLAGPTVIRGVPVSGEAHSPSLVTSGNRSTGATLAKSPIARKHPAGSKTPERRSIHKARAVFSACIDQLDIAQDEEADFFNRNNALEHFRESLEVLWRMRDAREEAFADVINMLQALFIHRRVEDFSRDQLETLRSVVAKLDSQTEFDDDFADSITLDLLDGGLDVFRELE